MPLPALPAGAKPDIQFFPEGGSLVTGVRSKVAFKAIGINGLGTNVKGEITDSENNRVCVFESAHLGMGFFYLAAKPGETYRAKLTYTSGVQDIVELPKAEASGIVLTINNDSIPKAAVRIEANAAFYRQYRGRNFTLLIYSGGLAVTVNCKLDSTVINLDILKRRLHTGIATLTLFSPANEPLCERILFVQNYDQLNLAITGDKTVYSKREKVNLQLNAKTNAHSAAAGHFSVSVTDESKVPSDENNESTILSSLLLTSDLKGYVQQPNSYFSDTSASAAKNLDMLMLTHGYRRFMWKPALNDGSLSVAYLPEKGLEVSGMLKNLFNKPVYKGTVTLVSLAGGPMFTTATNSNGKFSFNNLVFMNNAHFILSAVNAKGKKTAEITYFPDKPQPVGAASPKQTADTVSDSAMAAYIDNTKNERNAFVNYGRGNGIMLKEVKIRDKKPDDQYRTQSLAGAGFADQVMHADEISRIGGQLSTGLDGRLHGVVFSRGAGGTAIPFLKAPPADGPMLVVVDGVEMNKEFDINLIPSSQIETIEVLKYASTAMYGMSGGNGVLVITTKQGGGFDPKDIASVGVLPISPVGFYKPRQFYSPKYEYPNDNLKRPDLRSTIYWQPGLVTDKNGLASFDYYNADGVGTYKVTIEGIDSDGNIGRQVYRYKVE
jgi:TonB-dependent SusC/RagA subfamily outer membrane receptor